jgi:hypothetical protein
MKNLYFNYLVIFFFILLSRVSYAQNYITWNQVDGGGAINGVAGPVNAWSTLNAGTTAFVFNSPATFDVNLIVNGSLTFSTFGPTFQGQSRDLTINFSQPVIVTRYNMVDIDLGDNQWNDTFLFQGINFSNNPNPIAQNCIANLNGAIATMDVDGNAENASWFCSNPVSSFTIDYQTTGFLTHAYLGYSIEVLIPPSINNNNNTLCLNSAAPNFPIVGNNILGTWNPNVINTNAIGQTNYIFTPNLGQPIQCPISMTVNVVDCCLPTLLLTAADNMTNAFPVAIKRRERSNWISASNIIGIGNNNFQDGVVYHAGNFVDLTPGFDAINGSQFAAYPEDCSGNYVYRNSANVIENSIKEIEVERNYKQPKVFKITIESGKESLDILMMNLESDGLKIYTLDGKVIYEDFQKNKNDYEIDISSLSKGIYIISVTIDNGSVFSEKFIKN